MRKGAPTHKEGGSLGVDEVGENREDFERRRIRARDLARRGVGEEVLDGRKKHLQRRPTPKEGEGNDFFLVGLGPRVSSAPKKTLKNLTFLGRGSIREGRQPGNYPMGKGGKVCDYFLERNHSAGALNGGVRGGRREVPIGEKKGKKGLFLEIHLLVRSTQGSREI